MRLKTAMHGPSTTGDNAPQQSAAMMPSDERALSRPFLQYNATNPFEWMDMISLQGKTNFFEKRVGDYQKAGVMSSVGDQGSSHAFSLEEDF